MTEQSTTLQLDLEQARLYAETLWSNGVGEGDVVCCMLRSRASKERMQFSGDFDAASVGDGLQELVTDGWDVYVTPCRFAFDRPLGKESRKEDDVIWAPGVWADIDVKSDIPTMIQSQDELDRVIAALPASTMLVDTGSGGRHAYWLFDQPLTDTDRARRLTVSWIVQISKVASDTLGRTIKFDPVGDLARILKLPGTWRHPKAPIWTPQPVRLLHANGPRYSADSLEEWITPQILDDYDRVGIGINTTLTLNIPADDPRVQAYVKRAVEREASDLAGWATGAPPGRNSMLNRAAFSLGTLGAHGLVDYETIRATLLESCRANGLLQDDGSSHCESTLDSGWFSGLQQPRALPDFETPAYNPPSDAPQGDESAAANDDPWPPAPDHMATGRKLVSLWSGQSGIAWLRRYREIWYSYRRQGGYWAPSISEEPIRSSIWLQLDGKWSLDKEGDPKAILPNRAMVNNVLDALVALVRLPDDVDMPVWLDGAADEPTRPPAKEFVVLQNGMVHLPTRQHVGHDERLFTTVSLPFDYDHSAQCPEWTKFLESLWPDDPESIECLQEIFGYVLSGRTDLQKIPMIIGRPRSGKSTIGNILRALVGERNTTAITLSGLAKSFGLEKLIGKTFALISDARIRGETYEEVQRLLSISGADVVPIDRKYRTDWVGQIPVRFMLISNELPRLDDPSGAIVSRFLPLIIRVPGWADNPDIKLPERLMGELPGIFNWGLDGVDRLEDRFTVPSATMDAIADLQESSSPIGSFVAEYCDVGESYEVEKSTLIAAWNAWAAKHGHRTMSDGTFGIKLRTVVPTVSTVRHREGGGSRRSYYVGLKMKELAVAPSGFQWQGVNL